MIGNNMRIQDHMSPSMRSSVEEKKAILLEDLKVSAAEMSELSELMSRTCEYSNDTLGMLLRAGDICEKANKLLQKATKLRVLDELPYNADGSRV